LSDWRNACPAQPPTRLETAYADFDQWIGPLDGQTLPSPDQPELSCTDWNARIKEMLGEPVTELTQPVDPDIWELIWTIEDWITQPPENHWP
jgi:hypothetical protein